MIELREALAHFADATLRIGVSHQRFEHVLLEPGDCAREYRPHHLRLPATPRLGIRSIAIVQRVLLFKQTVYNASGIKVVKIIGV